MVQLPAALVAHVKSGDLRVLAMMGAERDPVFPDVPTAKELGLPVALDMWRGVAAPEGTPKPVIAMLQNAIRQSVQSPAFKEAGRQIGFTPAFLPADDFDELIASDDVKLAQLMAELGIKRNDDGRRKRRPPPYVAAGSRRASDRPLLPRLVSARAGGIATAAALAAVGLWFVWQASLLDLGDFELPGPGFFPLVLGGVVFICASFLAARLWASSPYGEAIAFGHRDVLIVIGALFVVPLLFDRLGALITLGLFGAVVLVLVARCSLWLAAVSAAVAMVACCTSFRSRSDCSCPPGSCEATR